ncbi:hypothetical protein [Streptomyces sp. NBC_00582]|uniref:hypothetical protein n=1 Tax=Streptomyces sp. NBC_00582 TaxID=2975783 RepID=UPI002E81CE1F|nr:hypothetical protein [Streptomyces sp. NBC_00582]WUB61531.1 hypothetical protein OG852_14585 [Streptomyces sp. NBC_00582]
MGDVRMKRVRQAAAAVRRWPQGVRAVRALTWSRLGYAGGCLTASTGAGMQFGTAWGLMLGGAVAAASFLLLVDVEERGADGGR